MLHVTQAKSRCLRGCAGLVVAGVGRNCAPIWPAGVRRCNRLCDEHQQASIQSCLMCVMPVQALLHLRDSCLQACKPFTLSGQSTAMLVMFLSSALYMLYHLVHRSWFASVVL